MTASGREYNSLYPPLIMGSIALNPNRLENFPLVWAQSIAPWKCADLLMIIPGKKVQELY